MNLTLDQGAAQDDQKNHCFLDENAELLSGETVFSGWDLCFAGIGPRVSPSDRTFSKTDAPHQTKHPVLIHLQVQIKRNACT